MPVKVITFDQLCPDINAQILKDGSIFGAISEDAINFLLQQGKLFQAQHGDRIFDYGDRGDNFFIVCKGSVDFYKQHEDECVHTRSVDFGGELGFVAMIALHDHTGYAVAREDSVLLQISSMLFRELHKKYPFDFGVMTLNLARDMARVIRKLSNTLVKNSIKY